MVESGKEEQESHNYSEKLRTNKGAEKLPYRRSEKRTAPIFGKNRRKHIIIGCGLRLDPTTFPTHRAKSNRELNSLLPNKTNTEIPDHKKQSKSRNPTLSPPYPVHIWLSSRKEQCSRGGERGGESIGVGSGICSRHFGDVVVWNSVWRLAGFSTMRPWFLACPPEHRDELGAKRTEDREKATTQSKPPSGILHLWQGAL